MAVIDAMSPAWRTLVYEYGFTIVAALYDEGGGIEAARTDLETWRERQQAQHLRAVARGDYRIPKSAFFAGRFKTATEYGLPKISFSI